MNRKKEFWGFIHLKNWILRKKFNHGFNAQNIFSWLWIFDKKRFTPLVEFNLLLIHFYLIGNLVRYYETWFSSRYVCMLIVKVTICILRLRRFKISAVDFFSQDNKPMSCNAWNFLEMSSVGKGTVIVYKGTMFVDFFCKHKMWQEFCKVANRDKCYVIFIIYVSVLPCCDKKRRNFFYITLPRCTSVYCDIRKMSSQITRKSVVWNVCSVKRGNFN